MFRYLIYPILILILSCSRSPHYNRWEVGNWAVYRIGEETLLYTVMETKGEERFRLEIKGIGFCINSEVETGEIIDIYGTDSISIDIGNIVLDLGEKAIQITDTILGGKRIVMERLNDSLWISPQVPIFGIVTFGEIQLIDFGYRNPAPLNKYLPAEAS